MFCIILPRGVRQTILVYFDVCNPLTNVSYVCANSREEYGVKPNGMVISLLLSIIYPLLNV